VAASAVESVLEDALRTLGWRFMHQRPAQTARGWRTALTGDKGFPDYVAIRRDRMLFIEAKGKANRLEPEQLAWRDAIEAAGGEYHVVRPANLDDFVRAVLASR